MEIRGPRGESLEDSPTYAVATTAFLFILVSLVVERCIHRLKKYLKRKNQKPLRKVLDKMTEELMLLGFISLLLTVLQSSVVKICVPSGFSKHLLPCKDEEYKYDSETFAPAISPISKVGRRLLHYSLDVGPKRHLLTEEEAAGDHCKTQGKVRFVSAEVMHQLHLFIFVLAVTHVCYSFMTVCLGFARLHRWRRWERETQYEGYDGNLDLERRYRKILESKRPLPSPGRHSNALVDSNTNHAWHESPFSTWTFCFFRQFVAAVSREDYLVFRVRFLNTHSLPESFNFWDYVIRSMEVEFKKIIGISWWLWLFVILFMLLNVHGWYTYFWMAFIPTIILLFIGTAQQHIIATLATEAKRHAADVLSAESHPEISLGSAGETEIAHSLSSSDVLFWFDNPAFLLRLLHFVIFQNSFELAILFWLLITFGWNSCILGDHTLLIVRVTTGLLTQLLASYSTLPIYALVTQMGSQMKETIFRKDVYQGLQVWKAKARRRSSLNASSDPGFQGSIAQAATEGSEPVQSRIDPPPPPEEGTSDSSPRVPNPELAKRFQKIYGKIRAAETIKAGAQVNRRN